MPRQPVPALSVPLVGGGTWTLHEQQPQHFTMISFYRGLHCPQCGKSLAVLGKKYAEFEKLGVHAVAISSDTAERAAQAKEAWGLGNVPVGYGLPLDVARQWGLFISTSRGVTSTGVMEPPLFSEPGLFLVRPDGTLYASAIQTMPFARPSYIELVSALEFIITKDYPARGEVVDHTQPTQ